MTPNYASKWHWKEELSSGRRSLIKGSERAYWCSTVRTRMPRSRDENCWQQNQQGSLVKSNLTSFACFASYKLFFCPVCCIWARCLFCQSEYRRSEIHLWDVIIFHVQPHSKYKRKTLLQLELLNLNVLCAWIHNIHKPSTNCHTLLARRGTSHLSTLPTQTAFLSIQ
jgi:hypothetical protein